jgi:hypothetical protein
MFWMNGDTTPYDGKRLYTVDDLTTDLAAGELIVKAIRTKQLFTTSEVLLNRALEHVFAAVHDGAPKQDWLHWMYEILDDIPMEPLNCKGRPRKKHRGNGKALSYAAFVSTLPSGLTRREERLLWLDFKK